MHIRVVLSALAGIVVFSGCIDAARILAVIPTPSRSHYIWNRSLILALAKRGHHLTILSPDKEKEPVPNLKLIFLEGSYQAVNEAFNYEDLANVNAIDTVKFLWEWGIESCKQQMQTEGAKELLKMPPDSFDLILTETVLHDCMYVFMHHFGGGTRIPVIGMTAFGIGPWVDIMTGARTMPSVFAFPALPYLSKMNFWERFYNTIVTGSHWTGMLYYAYPKHQEIAEKAYGKAIPSIPEIGSNISLVLVNNHYVINGPQPQLPGIVEVGGMHCKPSKPLPKDIDTFINGSQEEAIYFSLGSNLKSELLSRDRQQMIVRTFAALGPKIRVVWKFDPDAPIDDLPSNVLLKKWLPQEDILGHPKLLVFVTHGGLLSTQESIYHGVPIIGVPFVADQRTNVRRLEELKVAKEVNILTTTEDLFAKTILSVVRDDKYRQNMKVLSRLFRDQPQTPLERAIFWTEFVLRNGKGRIESLRAPGIDLAWYQYFLLDVIAVFFLSILIAVLVLIASIHFVCRMIFKMTFKSQSSKDSKKYK
ncbi:UDP-glycosyltransferase [Ladona fulva]|uniref:UDP-glucuronosyltransferase n=1 Tax=Ladona fulva TaxID=123851 RepID=A0A8K0KPR9_LADFU|nr:UDP-glycosyltransferase [Ladona fulva]